MSVEEKIAAIAAIAQDPKLTLEEKNAKIIDITTGAAKKEETAKQVDTNGTTDMTVEEKLSLITSNLQESLNPEIMEDVLRKGERPLTIYWGRLRFKDCPRLQNPN